MAEPTGQDWSELFGSVATAAVATLVAAISALPILDAFDSFWPGFLILLAWTGALHVGVGAVVPRIRAAMAVPPVVLYAWMLWAWTGDLMRSTGESDGLSAAQAFGLLAVAALAIGAALAGFVALGAALRQAGRGSRARRAPYP